MSRTLSTTTRPFIRRPYQRAPLPAMPGTNGRPPVASGPAAMPPFAKGTALPGGVPFAGMDPSDPTTYVRPWNPQPGMVARLNFDGAQVQGETEMGGLWQLPARRDALAAGRPRRRPR